ncbi:MAG: TRAP transporter substrate-binding protein [Spirochaetales bacterium]|jgi:tripartite ATP-independent transporter DctP family solute receptor|nr:TRAP transporter substrate-binding protein [Spirochaetales bacterium]
MKGKKTKLTLCAMILTVVLILVLGGCSGSGSSGTSAPASSSAQAPAPKVLKFAMTNAPDTFIARVVSNFAAIANKNGNGSLDVQVFPASQLGDQRDYIEGLKMGTLEMCLIATGALEGFEPRFIIFSLPFVFESASHMHRFYESEISQKVLEDFRTQQGIRHVGIVDEGMRQVWTSNIEIKTLADFQKLTIRVPEVPLYVNMFKALKANPTPMALGDVYMGVQTGVINAFENGVDNFVANKLDEVLKISNSTNHTGVICSILLAEKVFESLSPEQQKVIIDAGKEATDKGITEFEASQENLYASLQNKGVKRIKLSDDTMTQIRSTLQEVVRDQLKGMYDYDELVKAILSLR